jgi:hypothetical protein
VTIDGATIDREPRCMQDAAPASPPLSNLAVGLWLLLGFVLTMIGAVVVGVAAYDSESAGMTASYIVAGPVGFGWGAGIGALIGRFALAKSPTAAKLAAPGCGCGCGLFLALGVAVFMLAIFPAL